MPPTKGKGREAGRSRNSTPVSAASTEHAQISPTLPQGSNGRMTYDDVLDNYCRSASPPPSAVLKKIAEALKLCSDIARTREETCSKGMREFAKKKKVVAEQVRQKEIAEREIEAEMRERANHAAATKAEDDDPRPPAIGAHGLARQDGKDDEGNDRVETTALVSGNAASPMQSSDSEETHQPRPATTIPQAQTFGEDPSTFEDPTIYHIRGVPHDATDEEKKEIYNVAEYPLSDLHDLTPGTPPDRDFSQAKPTQQATATQFAHYLEPYFRPLTMEDMALLEERGDRTAPLAMPRRGSKSYKEIWAEEDAGFPLDVDQSMTDAPTTNHPKGSLEQMNDGIAESNDISAGPMLTRLLSTLHPERRGPTNDPNTNGDPSTHDPSIPPDSTAEANEEATRPPPPATYMSESHLSGWKNQNHKHDFAQTDERLKQELRYIGFLPEDGEPDYDGHHDDEVAARLRYLQEELQAVSVLNGARKSRIKEIADEELAKQEWSTIAEDLDTQLNQAYLKRHRNLGKGKKVMKRPGTTTGGLVGAAGAAGVTKQGLGDQVKGLMKRREEWNELGGQVVNHGRTPVPKGTIFDEENMRRLMEREREGWSEAQEQS
ncbi:MAG: Transcriptional regulator [Chrysothrix sp. TS-e1954]|nr:MAG: Transcriptional regulator [Chrysothrix sp. TS-e1954]